jgi:hypothetical protein
VAATLHPEARSARGNKTRPHIRIGSIVIDRRCHANFPSSSTPLYCSLGHDLVIIVYDLQVHQFTRAKAVYGHHDLSTVADAKRGAFPSFF